MSDDLMVGDEDVGGGESNENEYDKTIRKILAGEAFQGNEKEAEEIFNGKTIDLSQHQILQLLIYLQLPKRINEINVESITLPQLRHFSEQCKGNWQLLKAIKVLELKRKKYDVTNDTVKEKNLYRKILLVAMIIFIGAVLLDSC